MAGALVMPLAGAAVAAEPAPHKLSVGDKLPRFAFLKPGRRSYLRSQLRDGGYFPVDVWQREVRFERVDGTERLRIIQRWDGGGKDPTRVDRDSLLEMGTFRPLTHIRITRSLDKTVTEGFRFGDKSLIGIRDLAENTRADLDLPFPEPMYNFETDMEMLQTLPLARDYAVSIPFFHPVGGAPARYIWRVATEDTLRGPDGSGIACWVVETNYNRPGGAPARFWLTKTTQQLIKNEATAPDGTIHRKTLLF